MMNKGEVNIATNDIAIVMGYHYQIEQPKVLCL